MKTCTWCHNDKPDEEFSWKNKAEGIRTTYCKTCYATKRRKTYHERDKDAIIANNRERKVELKERFRVFKEELECELCGENDSCCLDFHHTDPDTKDIAVSQAVATHNWGWERVMSEVEKCVVLCANCHRKVHAGRVSL